MIVDKLPSPETPRSNKDHGPTWLNNLALLVWLMAGVVAFLPFAFDTSPFDAVLLHVPGNQGNWWHALAGAPFFLAFPMVWLRAQSLFSRPSTPIERRLIWIVTSLSTVGTVLVELPFLLHLAGTSDWQRLFILSLGFGVLIASAIILLFRRRLFVPTQALYLGVDAAWLANASLCLVVYSGASGNLSSRSGWFVTIVIVWPIALELLWLFFQAFRTPASVATRAT